MHFISLEEAQTHLVHLIERLRPGQEIVITRNERPIARLTCAVKSEISRKLGTMKGTVRYIAPDFDAPLDDFKDYMA